MDATLTLLRPFVAKENTVQSESNEKETEIEKKKGETKKRKTLEEILAAAEEEFELTDTVCDSAVKALKSGKEIQRFSAIRNLTDLLENEENYNDIITRVFPTLQELLVSEPSNLDIHCEAAVVFKNIIRDTKYTQKYIGLVDKLLDYILHNLENQKENVTAAAWLESLVEIADIIPIKSVVEMIVPLALSQAEPTRRVQRRVISARLVEKLATIIPPESLRRDLIPCVRSLCKDPSPAVRTTITQRLATIAQSLSNLTDCTSSILPCLVELCCDDDAGVREAGLNAITNCFRFITTESLHTTVIPLLRKCTEQALIIRDASIIFVARQLGTWLQSLRHVLSDIELEWFLLTYRRILEFSLHDADAGASTSSMLYVSCRRMCAYNFPCFATIYRESNFNAELIPILERLSKDMDDEVRSTIASGFHEIVQLCSVTEQHALMKPFVELLCSNAADVVQHLTGSLDRILPALYAGFDNEKHLKGIQRTPTLAARRSSVESATKSSSHTIPSSEQISRPYLDRILIRCNRIIRGTGSWRSHESYLRNIVVLRRLVPLQKIYTSFVPMLQQEVLTARALPCRIAAARTLLLMMREFPKAQKRSKIIVFFTKEIGGHISCHRRRLLLDLVPIILENFSREFFIVEFFDDVLQLATDKISNIRLQLCRTMPKIKTYLSFPVNDVQLKAMDAVVRNLLMNEQNTNTRMLIQDFAAELSRAETDSVQCRENSAKQEEERQLWTEDSSDESLSNDDTMSEGVTCALENETPPGKPIILRRSATANLADLSVSSERATKLATSINNLTKSLENEYTLPEHTAPPRPPTRSGSLTTGSTLPPSNWRTSRPDRSKMAIVRPQPQITITSRSPSPMPSGDGKKDGMATLSKLPLSTARYRSANNPKITEPSSHCNSHLEKASPMLLKSVESPLKKYRLKTDASLTKQNRQTTSVYSKRIDASTKENSSDVMTRSASSTFKNVVGASSNETRRASYFSNAIHRPYGLMKVKSTSAVQKKPGHLSIRVISMS